MKTFRPILIIGIIEILIGGITLVSTLGVLLLGLNTKPFNILLFVISAACFSTLIGIGLLRFEKIAYQLLLYFASVVLLSKILIFMGVLHFSGEIETFIPSPVKNSISILYHGFVLYYLLKKDIKQIFHK